MNIRSWLRKSPQPSKLRADGKEIAINDGKWKWADAERAIVALEPSKLEALDANGVVLRACQLDNDGEATEEKDGKPATAACPHCGRSDLNVTIVGEQLRRAADESASRHGDSYKYAFDAVVAMFNAQSTRLAGLETAWQKMVMAAATEGGEAGGLLEQMVAGFMQGKAEGAAANGASKKKS